MYMYTVDKLHVQCSCTSDLESGCFSYSPYCKNNKYVFDFAMTKSHVLKEQTHNKR